MNVIMDILIWCMKHKFFTNAVWLLGIIGNAYVVNSLIHALKSENGTFQCRAAYVLGQIGNPRAVMPLITAMHLNCITKKQEIAIRSECRTFSEQQLHWQYPSSVQEASPSKSFLYARFVSTLNYSSKSDLIRKM